VEPFPFAGVVSASPHQGKELQGKGKSEFRAKVLFKMLEGGSDVLGAGHCRFQLVPQDSVVAFGEDIANEIVHDFKLLPMYVTIVIDKGGKDLAKCPGGSFVTSLAGVPEKEAFRLAGDGPEWHGRRISGFFRE
jgi:hypothetical protein